MKKIFFLFLSSSSLAAFAQQKTITQAIITTKTTIIAPENEDEANTPPPVVGADGQQVVIRRFGDAGETKSITYIKNDLVKTVINSEMGRTSTIRDNAQKKTTTLMEMMGNKTGFYATDAEMEEGRKRMDSMMQSRNPSGENRNSTPASVDINYTEETKKIAGYDCKKAFVITTRTTNTISQDGVLGTKTTRDTAVVWFCPDIKIQGLTNTGGAGGGFAMFTNSSLGGLDKLSGFPLQYEMNMRRGRKMVVEVIKLETDKEIKDKEFEVPKDFELKAMKDMQGPGGGMQFRIRG